MILAYSEIIIKKSSYVSFGRPSDPKTNSSHACWFWLLEIVALFKLLVVYIAKLIIIHLEVTEKFTIILYFKWNEILFIDIVLIFYG